MATVAHPLRKGDRTIRLPWTESEYDRCFLHAWIKIRDRAKNAFREPGREVQTCVREVYYTPSKRDFSQRLRRLREWLPTPCQSPR